MRFHAYGQQANEKMLRIPGHQGNTDQNHNEIPPPPVRMGNINKAGNHKCWRGCGERGTLLHCWGECEPVQPLWETVWRFFKVLKNRSALQPINCTAGDLSQRYRCSEMPGYLHPDVSSSNVHNSQTVEAASVSIER